MFNNKMRIASEKSEIRHEMWCEMYIICNTLYFISHVIRWAWQAAKAKCDVKCSMKRISYEIRYIS